MEVPESHSLESLRISLYIVRGDVLFRFQELGVLTLFVFVDCLLLIVCLRVSVHCFCFYVFLFSYSVAVVDEKATL